MVERAPTARTGPNPKENKPQMAREQLLKSEWDEANLTITFKFKDQPNLGSVTFDAKPLPDDIRATAMLHGFEQKLRDKVAGQLKALGDSAKFAELFKGSVGDLTALFASGEWNEKGDGTGTPRVGLLIRAIARVKSVTTDVAKAWYDKQPEPVQKGLRAVPVIVTATAAIKAEDAARKPAPPAPDAAIAALESLA
jgi:hypothetical protein